MATTDTSEGGLEALIVRELTGQRDRAPHSGALQTGQAEYAAGVYVEGKPSDYDKQYALDLDKLRAFIRTTQPEKYEQLGLEDDGPKRKAFLSRLQGEIAKRGIVDVLRKGVQHQAWAVDLFYGTPSANNVQAAVRFSQNIFSVTRQVAYGSGGVLDLVLFINGLPVATFELKNSLTKQTADDAERQYKTDRDPRELLFQFGRCLVHFAVDDAEVRFCTKLDGKKSWFLPFNKGWKDGAGNPPNPDGLKTDYLWREVLTREGLANIIENYAQIVEEKDPRTGKKKGETQIFPRYHQLDVVRKLLADVGARGVGKRYLIQHSAGSGKSNSIAWLAHQLVALERDGKPVVDSIIVVTDRILLDRQIRDTIKQFAQVGSIVGHADSSGDLRTLIEEGKKIIITTVQKFPFIVDGIGNEHRDRTFAIIIDEAHSSQGGKATQKMHQALGADSDDDDETIEDEVNRVMESRKMLENASYFAFTATPKNKTLEIFGEPWPEGDKVKHRPFHSYTMKQAIQEQFILDVLQYYTPVDSYYRLMKRIEDDPEFDTKRANKKLAAFVHGHKYAIEQKARIIVDHFHDHVLAANKIGGEARAMVVTGSIQRAIEYYFAVSAYLTERKSPYKAIVAFSGEPEYGGQKVSEASLNGFPSNQIADKIREHPYRLLICAEKFQTGYDEPLLHTMYVDKPLSGIKAVQTLSRLNRAHPKKHDTFVLDFINDTDTIEKSFQDYYQTTILSEQTDPNKLHDLKAELDAAQIYDAAEIDDLVAKYLGGAERDALDPMLDTCVARYLDQLDEDGQVKFKGSAKAFVRTYSFLSAILPYSIATWEKLSIFLNFLIPKLPAPKEEDLAKGILEAIDMDSYRAEVRATLNIALASEDAEIGPVPAASAGGKPETELERLSQILKSFNDQFGNIEWTDKDKIQKVITEDLPEMVANDEAYRNAVKNSDKQNARIEHDLALKRVIASLVASHSQLYKQFEENPSFQKWLEDRLFGITYQPPQDS